MIYPRTVEEAVSKARGLLSAEDKDVLRNCSLEEASWRLHMTVGHQLRNEFGLWSEEAKPLFDDINAKMPHRLAVEGDSASAALIDALWHDARSRS
ncbi:hypothetical protein D9M72_366900 [compost metagenome]